jgi:hypothetical protein
MKDHISIPIRSIEKKTEDTRTQRSTHKKKIFTAKRFADKNQCEREREGPDLSFGAGD